MIIKPCGDVKLGLTQNIYKRLSSHRFIKDDKKEGDLLGNVVLYDVKNSYYWWI